MDQPITSPLRTLSILQRNTGPRLLAWSCCALASLIVAGCGGGKSLGGVKLYPVKGKILLHDGKPLTSGRVSFVGLKSTITSLASIESDGGFTFKSPDGDGLPEGEYRVVIDPAPPTSIKGSPAKTKIVLPFAAKYTDEDGSDLKATVTSDESKNSFVFNLEAKTK
jgi:hypothetical protein